MYSSTRTENRVLDTTLLSGRFFSTVKYETNAWVNAPRRYVLTTQPATRGTVDKGGQVLAGGRNRAPSQMSASVSAWPASGSPVRVSWTDMAAERENRIRECRKRKRSSKRRRASAVKITGLGLDQPRRVVTASYTQRPKLKVI